MEDHLTRATESHFIFMENIMESIRFSDALALVPALWTGVVGLVIFWRLSKEISIWWKTPQPEPEPEYVPPPSPPSMKESMNYLWGTYEEQCELIDESPIGEHKKGPGKEVMEDGRLNAWIQFYGRRCDVCDVHCDDFGSLVCEQQTKIMDRSH